MIVASFNTPLSFGIGRGAGALAASRQPTARAASPAINKKLSEPISGAMSSFRARYGQPFGATTASQVRGNACEIRDPRTACGGARLGIGRPEHRRRVHRGKRVVRVVGGEPLPRCSVTLKCEPNSACAATAPIATMRATHDASAARVPRDSAIFSVQLQDRRRAIAPFIMSVKPP
ncbi:MAG: hypothetical protein ABI678_12515 [Kofleriaceae bacterium]